MAHEGVVGSHVGRMPTYPDEWFVEGRIWAVCFIRHEGLSWAFAPPCCRGHFESSCQNGAELVPMIYPTVCFFFPCSRRHLRARVTTGPNFFLGYMYSSILRNVFFYSAGYSILLLMTGHKYISKCFSTISTCRVRAGSFLRYESQRNPFHCAAILWISPRYRGQGRGRRDRPT